MRASSRAIRAERSAVPGPLLPFRDAKRDVVDRFERTYAVRATILEPGGKVELGMSARVTARAKDDTTLRIEGPVAAIYSRGEQPQVGGGERRAHGRGARRGGRFMRA